MSEIFRILPLFGIILSLSICKAEEYYVTSTEPPNPACPSGKPCHTLNYYASNATLLDKKQNISLFFLKGTHNSTNHPFVLTSIQYLVVSSVSNASFKLVNPQVTIATANISFTNVSFMQMENIHLFDVVLYLNDSHWLCSNSVVYHNTKLLLFISNFFASFQFEAQIRNALVLNSSFDMQFDTSISEMRNHSSAHLDIIDTVTNRSSIQIQGYFTQVEDQMNVEVINSSLIESNLIVYQQSLTFHFFLLPKGCVSIYS